MAFVLPDEAITTLRELRTTSILCVRAVQNVGAMPEDTDAARRDKLIDQQVVIEYVERHLATWIRAVDLIERLEPAPETPCEISSKT